MKKFFSLVFVLLIILSAFAFSLNAFAAEKDDVEEDQEVVMEKEKNNKLKNANEIKMGGSITAKLSSDSDVDWFKFKTPSDGDIMFNFTHEADGVYAYYWYATVYSSDKKTVLNEGSLSGKEPSDFSVSKVKKGTYYLKISRISGGNPLTNGFTKAEYTVSVTSKCSTHGELLAFENSVEPTCFEPGEKVQKCSVCSAVVVTEKVNALGHSYNDWSIEEEAGIVNLGYKTRTCVLCGDKDSEMFMATSMIVLLIGIGVVVLAVIILVVIKNHRKPSKSYSSYSGSYSSGGYSGSSSYDSSSSYSSDSYSSGSGSYDDMPSSVYSGPYVSTGGMDYAVHYTDAEGYSTSGYYEDAEGYKHSTDGRDVQEFNWLDM